VCVAHFLFVRGLPACCLLPTASPATADCYFCPSPILTSHPIPLPLPYGQPPCKGLDVWRQGSQGSGTQRSTAGAAGAAPAPAAAASMVAAHWRAAAAPCPGSQAACVAVVLGWEPASVRIGWHTAPPLLCLLWGMAWVEVACSRPSTAEGRGKGRGRHLVPSGRTRPANRCACTSVCIRWHLVFSTTTNVALTQRTQASSGMQARLQAKLSLQKMLATASANTAAVRGMRQAAPCLGQGGAHCGEHPTRNLMATPRTLPHLGTAQAWPGSPACAASQWHQWQLRRMVGCSEHGRVPYACTRQGHELACG